MNNIITTAINKTNEDRLLEAIRTAQGLIGNIEREQNGLELLRSQIAEQKEAVKKIVASELTYEKVTGNPKPTNPTESEKAVIKAVEAIVQSRVGDVESRASSITSGIACKMEAVTATEARIADLRKQLADVSPATITPATIVG